MIAEVAEQPTDDVWILYDTGLAVTVCPHGFQEEHVTRIDSGGPRCEAATGNAVTLGGARDVPVDIADTNFSFGSGLRRSPNQWCRGCCVITPSGQTITLHRRQRTCWLRGRISSGGELEVLTITALRTNPEVEGFLVVAQDPGDEQAQEAASSSSRLWPQPEQQEHCGDRELLRETDGDTLEVSTEAVAAKARGIPVMPALAERQRHRLVHRPFRNR